MLQQMSDVTMPNPPKVINTCMWLWCEGGAGCTRCCAMSAGLAPSSCNQGCGRCAHQLSERARAPRKCLNSNHKPLEQTSIEWWRRVRGGRVVQSGCRGKWRCCVGLWQNRSKTIFRCFHTSRTSSFHPDFCYATSMVCAMMACYVLGSSERGNSEQFFPGPGRVVGECPTQADQSIIQSYIR
jgi:hypothetical protein